MPVSPMPSRPEALAFEHAPDATLILSARVILKASLMVEEVFGWRPRELEGQPIRVLYPGPTDYEVIGRRARQAMLKTRSHEDQRFMRHRSGRLIWMAGRGRAVELADPERLAVWTYRPLEMELAAPGALTRTESRIARYLVNGFTSKEIGQALGSSPRTVEVHRANMIRKMGVRNSSELVSKLLSAADWQPGLPIAGAGD